MLKVFKYEVPITDNFTIGLPFRARIIAFQLQHENPFIWALIDDQEKTIIPRYFRLCGTGHDIESHTTHLEYLGTIQMLQGDLIWHLFEIV